MNTQKTYYDLLRMQQEDLLAWSKILRPSCYEELEKRVNDLTTVPHPLDVVVNFEEQAHRLILRGDDIYRIVLSLKYMNVDWE